MLVLVVNTTLFCDRDDDDDDDDDTTTTTHRFYGMCRFVSRAYFQTECVHRIE